MTCDSSGKRARGAIGRVLACVSAGVLLGACQPTPAPAPAPGSAQAIQTSPWPLPVRHAEQFDLTQAPDSSVLLSWVEGSEGKRMLRFARLRNGHWSQPRTIATGDSFGNAMDVPHIRQTPDGALWVTRLVRGSGGKHARDIVLSRSGDDGKTWSTPVPVNDDGTPTEHGFVSAWASADDRLTLAWLDGRATMSGAPRSLHQHGGGSAPGASPGASTGASTGAPADQSTSATMLRSTSFGPDLRRGEDSVLDAMTCDCCQTNVVAAGGDALLAYRGRTASEERDILVTRFGRGEWSRPALVNADHWVMPACPVNGPAIAANKARVGVAWYTAPDDRPRLRLARSSDSGGTFVDVRDIDDGPDVTGQAGIALGADDTTWVSWLRATPGGQALWVAALDGDVAGKTVKQEVAKLQTRGRVGAPRMLTIGQDLVLVWVDALGSNPELKSLRLSRQ